MHVNQIVMLYTEIAQLGKQDRFPEPAFLGVNDRLTGSMPYQPEYQKEIVYLRKTFNIVNKSDHQRSVL